MDVTRAASLVGSLGIHCTATILDPWYNKGVGGVVPRAEYDAFIQGILQAGSALSPHVFLWGFPEIVARYVDDHPDELRLEAWLTWYYKNNPSVIRGWRSAQMTCLHFARSDAVLHPEHFLNEKQLEKQAQGKLRYMPGPTSVLDEPVLPSDVIECSLLVGFVGKKEQTGHPSQKPVKVYEKLILMATAAQEVVFDPMAGSGTSGVVARLHDRIAILSDSDERFVSMMEDRLGVHRIRLPSELVA